MKASNIFLTIFFFAVTFSVFGQEQSKKIKIIRIHDIYISTGFCSEHNTNGSLTDFRTLAPQSGYLKNNFTDYSQPGGSNWTTNNMYSVMLGIQFGDKEKTSYKANPLLRLGVSYYSGAILSNHLSMTSSKPYDTLTYSQTGQTVYLDSVSTRQYGMDYTSEQLRFDGSLIFRTNPDARWSLYAGIGITAGLSFNANTYIYYDDFNKTETRSPNGSYTSSQYDFTVLNNNKVEGYRNKNNFGFSTYIPMGIDFRIGKKSGFWKRTHLFYELRSGINLTSIPELRTIAKASVQNTFGLRVSWD
jgi:hypothetical protein